MLPHEIEATSMRIIQAELTGRGITLAHDCKDIILRVIHATADFDFAHIMQFSHGVCEQAAMLFQTAAPVIITNAGTHQLSAFLHVLITSSSVCDNASSAKRTGILSTCRNSTAKQAKTRM